MSPILGIWASQNYSRYSLPTSFESIATTTVGAGGTSTVTFSSIPSTYTHLQVRAIARSTAVQTSTNCYLRFNSDSGSNYSTHYLLGQGTSASAGAETSTAYIYTGALIAASSTASSFEGSVIDVLDYANTNKYKTVRTLAGWDANGSGFIALWSGSWRNTNAVTSITLLPAVGNFAQYSHFALYGVKGD